MTSTIGNISVESTTASVSEACLLQALQNLINNSPTFRQMMADMNGANGGLGENVTIRVEDGSLLQNMQPALDENGNIIYDENNNPVLTEFYARTYDDQQAPNTSEIFISHQFLETVNYITDQTTGANAPQSLERVLAHELTHSWQDALNGAQNENQATDLENAIMKEAFPNELPRDGYTNSTVFVPAHPVEKHPPTTPHRSNNSTIDEEFDEFSDAGAVTSPLTIDLDGDGIELVSLANSTHYWDIDNDGMGESTGWVAADDGLLVIDLNGDGVINDHSELFGTATIDGFTILSAYDSNIDGTIDSSDTQWSDLLVWQDINQNGYSEDAELKTLTEWGIVSISLSGVSEVSQTIEGNEITHESTVIWDDLSTTDIVDAWFTVDQVNTTYMGSGYTVDYDALFLPGLRGYGDLPSLFIGT